MDRIVGIETEYGCLLSEEEPHVNSELWPAKVKNHLFRNAEAGTIDLHYRDYEEPPGNGGFLRNGGRLYLDMGHIEYASPECLHLHDVAAYELAGDDLLQSSLIALGAQDRVSFIKNNVDHHTGATFGCHENYLMKREAQFTPPILGTLLTFLATRQIFTGAGRVGQSNPLAFDFEPPQMETRVNFQLSNGLLILRTTGPLVHSTCSGNFISWRKSTCATAARKLVGSWKTGDSFSKQLQTTIRRSLAGSTGLRRNGSWKHSSSPKDWVGMIRGCKASTLNITTSIHFAGYSLLSRLASELRSGTTMYGVPVQHMFHQLIRVHPVGLERWLSSRIAIPLMLSTGIPSRAITAIFS